MFGFSRKPAPTHPLGREEVPLKVARKFKYVYDCAAQLKGNTQCQPVLARKEWVYLKAGNRERESKGNSCMTLLGWSFNVYWSTSAEYT